MADSYTFVGATDVSLFQPPNSQVTAHQVAATANKSGVGFVAIFTKQDYKDAAYVAETLNGIASGFDTFSSISGVEGISTYQDTDNNGQLLNKASVTVASTSGRSTTVIDADYPIPEFINESIQTFAHLVAATQAELDAVENA